MLTGINFSAVFTGVGSVFKSFVDSLVHFWQYYLIAVLIATAGYFVWDLDHTRAALVKEKAAHVADIASFKNAQAAADAKAQTERAVLQKESKADADQADANYTGLLAQYHASLLRYSAIKGNSSTTNHNQLPTTEGGYGPGPGTELPSTIVISGDDAQICAVNTARLVAVHDWAVKLPKEATLP